MADQGDHPDFEVRPGHRACADRLEWEGHHQECEDPPDLHLMADPHLTLIMDHQAWGDRHPQEWDRQEWGLPVWGRRVWGHPQEW